MNIKKYISILMTILMLFSFVACGDNITDESNYDETQSPASKMVDGTGIAMQIQEYKDNIIAEIPVFVTDEKNKAIDSLNNEIDEKLMSIYLDEQKKDEENLEQDEDAGDYTWADIRAYPMTGQRYIQVSCTAAVFGSSDYIEEDTQGHVYSFIYDSVNKKQITKEDILKLAGTTEEEVTKSACDSYKAFEWASGETVECTIDGFRIIESEKGDEYEFYVYMVINNEDSDEEYSVIGILSSENGNFSLYNGTQLIESEYLDQFEPSLYYGM